MRDFERLDIREDERVEVEMPGNATDGFADVPEPEWLLEAARRAQQARNPKH